MVLLSILAATGIVVSTGTDTLRSATFVADRGMVASRRDTIRTDCSSGIADALLLNPSLCVNDNGGYAGLKTVSLRGLGSAHTDIYIDGVKVGNVQSGQCDIGLHDIGNFGGIVVDYAQNSLSFNTLRPVFKGSDIVSGRASFSAGSFGTFLPGARVDFRLNRRVSLSAHASGVISRGDFPLSDGTRRKDNDIRRVSGGLDAFGVTDGGDWHAKIWCNSSDRGTPGAVDWPSTERQRDLNVFAQGLLRRKFSPLYLLNVSAKASYDRISYLDDYRQVEFQLNSSHRFHVRRWLDFSVAGDFCWDGLDSGVYDASRAGVRIAAAAAFTVERFRADLAVEYNGYFDFVAEGGPGGRNRNNLSPSLCLRFNAFGGFDLVAFARRACRMPTFNELYFTGYGNPSLQAEDAWLTDIGFDFNRRSGCWKYSFRLDGFCNYLTNKIVSAPSGLDPNIWFPYNIGRVRAVGSDVSAGAVFENNGWKAVFNAKYTFQNARDLASKATVPYLARHSCVLDAACSWRGWLLSCVWNLRAGRHDSLGEMPDWNTLDITFRKDIGFRGCGPLGIFVRMNNLLDCRYETAGGYPMPGRAFTGGMDFKF